MSTTTPTAAGTMPDADLRTTVYAQLRLELMNGEIPFARRLTEPKVAARFGISRTPVREALARLCDDGLLARGEYGFSPVRPSIPLVRDLYEVRIALEMAGMDRAITNPAVVHDAALLTAERQRWEALRADPPAQEPGFVVVDERFHVALLTAAGNAELVRSLEAVNARIRHVRMFDFMVNNRIEVTIAEHLGILEAVLSGDLPEARRLLRRHIGESLDVVLERVTNAIVAMTLASDEVTR